MKVELQGKELYWYDPPPHKENCTLSVQEKQTSLEVLISFDGLLGRHKTKIKEVEGGISIELPLKTSHKIPIKGSIKPTDLPKTYCLVFPLPKAH